MSTLPNMADVQNVVETTAPSPQSAACDICLRALDVALSAVLLLTLLPLFAVITLAVCLDSRGPVLFRQTRVGQGGRRFCLLKFRSMVTDAEARRETLELYNERTGPVFKMRRDPRVTRIGRWLRRWSLDELPQLLNVLRGDMSLVGPRPALPSEVDRYSDLQRARLTVPPGLTGLWQVSGRASLSFERAVELDLLYVQRRSLSLNLSILLRTLPAVLSGRGAY
ncbi:MAG: sugar transferase [Armatimonadota bacterium]|nr:sugar transferase [Armatimonadota bacterium]